MIYDIIGATVLLTPVIVLLLVATPFLDRRYNASGRYALWIFVMIGLWLPLFSFLPRIVVFEAGREYVPMVAMAIWDIYVPTANEGLGDLVKSSQSHIFTGLTGISLFSVIWVFGVILSVSLHIYSYLSLRRFVRQWGVAETSPSVIAIFERECAALGVSGGVRLLRVKGIKTPLLFGLFKPAVLLPPDMPLDELPLILRHELVHFYRRDLFYKLAIVVTTCLHWFNPAVHLMARQANKDIEAMCDSLTVSSLGVDERRFYSEILLGMAAGSLRSAISTHFFGGKNMLRVRFANIFSTAKKRGSAVFFPLGLVFVFLGGFVGFDFSQAHAFELLYMDAATLPPLEQMTNQQLASWTLQRNHGHCDAELAELRSRFAVIEGAERTLTRVAPMGLARRLMEIENRRNLSNQALVDIVLTNNPVHDIRLKNELTTRLRANFQDTDIEGLCIRTLAFRLRDWENFSPVVPITPDMREGLLLRLGLYYPSLLIESFRELSNFELTFRISRQEGWGGRR